MHPMIDDGSGFSFGEVLYPSGGTYGPLNRGYLNLLIVREGQMVITYDDKSSVLGAGEICVYRNRRRLFLTCPSGRMSHIAWCETRSSETSEMMSGTLDDIESPLQITDRIKNLLELGTSLGTKSDVNINEFRNSIGRAIFLSYYHESYILHHQRHIPSSVIRAPKIIEERFSEALTVEEIAKLAGVTRQYLATSFRHHFGISPIKYLWQVRVSRGHALLLRSGLSISDISYRCGYKTPFHFSRQVTDHFGIPPRQVRKNRGYHVPSEIAEDAPDIGAVKPDRNGST